MQYHILNGGCLAEKLKDTGINGNVIICRECLIEGPVENITLPDFLHARAEFISEEYGGPTEKYYSTVVPELEKLLQIPPGSEINLWFEDDLFCQVNMWFIVYLIAHNLKECTVYRVFPVIKDEKDLWKGFGISGREDLETAFKNRIKFDEADFNLSVNVWKAYQASDFEKLIKLSKHANTKCFKYLEEICIAHIARFPATGQKGRPEIAIEDIIKKGITNFEEVFAEFFKKNGLYGFSDVQVKKIYQKTIG